MGRSATEKKKLGQGGEINVLRLFRKNVIFFLLGDSPAPGFYVSNKSKNDQLKA